MRRKSDVNYRPPPKKSQTNLPSQKNLTIRITQSNYRIYSATVYYSLHFTFRKKIKLATTVGLFETMERELEP